MFELLFLEVGILPLNVELGVLAGLSVAIAGYLQAYSKVDEKGKHEKFDIDRFTKTVLLGALAGGILAFLGEVDYALNVFLASAGIVAIVSSLVKFAMRMKI